MQALPGSPPREAERRQQPRRDPRPERYRSRHGQHPRVDGDRAQARNGRGRVPEKRSDTTIGEQDTEGSANGRKDGGFAHEQTNHTGPVGPERHADAEFPCPVE